MLSPVFSPDRKMLCGIWTLMASGVILGAYYLHNPYSGFILPIILGFNIVVLLLNSELPFSVAISLSPAVGLSILAIGAYVSSHIGLPLSIYYTVYTLITALTSIFVCSIRGHILFLDVKETFSILLSAIGLVTVHYFAYTYPTDNVDNYFHATKTMYILKYDSMFPKDVLTFNMLAYPGGYHSFASYLVTITHTSIPDVMLAIRTLAWLLLVFGVYIFTRVWLDNKTAIYSVLVIISTNIVYYYLLVYIEPNFIGFYFFLVMLALTFILINNLSEISKLKFYRFWGVIIGTASLLFHPYSFQSYALVLTTYLIIKKRKTKITLNKISQIFVTYVLTPVILYTFLDPYFWGLFHRGIMTKGFNAFNIATGHDTWFFFKLMWNWATIRNSNYVGTLFMFVGSIYYLSKRKSKRAEVLSLLIFVLFVLGLNLDRLTINVPIPFYSTAAMEREFLWLVPVFPVLIGMGMSAMSAVLSDLSKHLDFSLKPFYVLLVASFFLIPTYGTARDLVSAEANFYVTPDVVEDFNWISTHYTSAFILGSCHSDSSPWLPFFEGSNYTLLSEPYFRKCHVGNKTIDRFVEEVLSRNETLPNTIAFIDTNAPSLNPLEFSKKYTLLRINGNDWIFDMSSRDISNNSLIMLRELRLCSSVLPGDIYSYGKYYIWGFTKKYFYVRYYAFNNFYVAWLSENTGIIAFNPCRTYTVVKIKVFALDNMEVNISINGKSVLKQMLNRGFHIMQVNAPVQKDVLNKIEIEKTGGVLMVISIKLGETI
ncbi:DUF6541 family protein [Thermococcus sp.]